MTCSESEPLRVCLERTVELEGARLRLRDWPGFSGPLVHVPDPLSPDDEVVQSLAARFAPSYRIVCIEARPAQPYQVHMDDVLATLDQFGFASPTRIGERLGCAAARLLPAWYPGRTAGLVLIDATFAAPSREDSIEARALRDCPPNWTTLRTAVRCPLLEVAWNIAGLESLSSFLQIP